MSQTNKKFSRELDYWSPPAVKLYLNYIKLDDSAFFRTQSYITEICHSEYLLSFGLQKKTFFSR